MLQAWVWVISVTGCNPQMSDQDFSGLKVLPRFDGIYCTPMYYILILNQIWATRVQRRRIWSFQSRKDSGEVFVATAWRFFFHHTANSRFEPQNHPAKENHLNQTSIFGVQNVDFPVCRSFRSWTYRLSTVRPPYVQNIPARTRPLWNNAWQVWSS